MKCSWKLLICLTFLQWGAGCDHLPVVITISTLTPGAAYVAAAPSMTDVPDGNPLFSQTPAASTNAAETPGSPPVSLITLTDISALPPTTTLARTPTLTPSLSFTPTFTISPTVSLTLTPTAS